MYIRNCYFLENHSRFSSNCLTYLGNEINIYNTTFSNNTSIFSLEIINLFSSGLTGLPDIAQVNQEIGGCFYFAGMKLIANRSIFINSTGFKGGAIFLTHYSIANTKQDVMITECYFKLNRGNFGGALSFPQYLQNIDILVIFCVFSGNFGRSKIISFI